jgi:hypothetical protein
MQHCGLGDHTHHIIIAATVRTSHPSKGAEVFILMSSSFNEKLGLVKDHLKEKQYFFYFILLHNFFLYLDHLH